MVFTTPFDAYLLKVWPPCDLRFIINAIGITSIAGDGPRAHRFHHRQLRRDRTGRWRCPIDEIRKVDYQRMKADLRLEAQSRTAQAAQ